MSQHPAPREIAACAKSGMRRWRRAEMLAKLIAVRTVVVTKLLA